MTLGLINAKKLDSCEKLMTVGSTHDYSLNKGSLITDAIISQVYNPMNLAINICRYFETHSGALVSAFVDDLSIFEYLYEFLPKDISVQVLNQIPLNKAIDIVERHPTSTFVYDQVDPILYVVRYFSEVKNRDPMSRDPHCIEFNKSIVPNGSALDFVLRCKNHLDKTDFQNLVKIMCAD